MDCIIVQNMYSISLQSDTKEEICCEMIQKCFICKHFMHNFDMIGRRFCYTFFHSVHILFFGFIRVCVCVCVIKCFQKSKTI